MAPETKWLMPCLVSLGRQMISHGSRLELLTLFVFVVFVYSLYHTHFILLCVPNSFEGGEMWWYSPPHFLTNDPYPYTLLLLLNELLITHTITLFMYHPPPRMLGRFIILWPVWRACLQLCPRSLILSIILSLPFRRGTREFGRFERLD